MFQRQYCLILWIFIDYFMIHILDYWYYIIIHHFDYMLSNVGLYSRNIQDTN